MSDEQIEPRPLHFTRHIALSVDEWPAVIEVTEAMLKSAYLYGGTVEGDELHFLIGNGEARYAIRRDRVHGRGFTADLIEGNDKANLKARRAKYDIVQAAGGETVREA